MDLSIYLPSPLPGTKRHNDRTTNLVAVYEHQTRTRIHDLPFLFLFLEKKREDDLLKFFKGEETE